MHRIVATGQAGKDNQLRIHDGGSEMATPQGDLTPGLVDLNGIPLADLARLDGVLLGQTLERLVPAVGGRLWSRDGCLSGDNAP